MSWRQTAWVLAALSAAVGVYLIIDARNGALSLHNIVEVLRWGWPFVLSGALLVLGLPWSNLHDLAARQARDDLAAQFQQLKRDRTALDAQKKELLQDHAQKMDEAQQATNSARRAAERARQAHEAANDEAARAQVQIVEAQEQVKRARRERDNARLKAQRLKRRIEGDS